MWVFTKLLVALSLLSLAASFDRTAVENPVKDTLGYRGDVEYRHPASTQPVSFYGLTEAEAKPRKFLAKTPFGTYYGAAANPWFLATLPQKNRDNFPQTKAQVQSIPQGISVYNARLEYLKAIEKPSLKSAKGE